MPRLPNLLRPRASDDYGPPRRSEWMDVDWRPHLRWVEVGGRRVNVMECGEGPALIYVHGLGGSWQNWLENILPFRPAHRVVALDLPGFGASDMPRGDISISGYADCLDEVCRILEIDAAAVVGNSMGGFIGAELAIRHPHRVDRLVLVAAAAFWQEYRRARPLLTMARMVDVSAAWLIARSEYMARHPRLRNSALASAGVRYPAAIPPPLAYEQIMGSSGREGFRPALNALASYSIREELPRIAAPTLVAWGAHDTLVSVRDSKQFEDLIPDSRKVIFERTGHMPMLERPGKFNRILSEFLAEEPAHGAPGAPTRNRAARGPDRTAGAIR
jgi:pimeloyl-ACP methyl ester carboxylesterase